MGGEKFAGGNPDTVRELSEKFLEPLGAMLRRYPMGSKQYNGQVERNHRAEIEELYRPYLLQAEDSEHLLAISRRWISYYNVLRSHFCEGVRQKPRLKNLLRLGYDGNRKITLLPPPLLDWISLDRLLESQPPPC